MWRKISIALLSVLAWSEAAQAQVVLPIPATKQYSPVWCWLAVGEMVFRSLGVPQAQLPPWLAAQVPANAQYQCGELAVNPSYGSGCPLAASAGSTLGLDSLLHSYPPFVGSPAVHLIQDGPLQFSVIQNEINNGRPIILGISPGMQTPSYPFGGGNTTPEHAVLLVGYTATGDVIINDPFPYQTMPLQPNPYLSAGGAQVGPLTYEISPAALVAQLRWTVSMRCLSTSPTRPPTC